MKYARLVGGVAVDVVTMPPALLFVPQVAAQFQVVPDIEQGAVFLPAIFNARLTAEREWKAPRSVVQEIEPGRFDYVRTPEPKRVEYPPDKEPRHLKKVYFWARLTPSEIDAIALARKGKDPAALALRDFVKFIDSLTPDIDLARDDVRAGVIAWERAGLIASGRAFVILDAPITDNEKT